LADFNKFSAQVTGWKKCDIHMTQPVMRNYYLFGLFKKKHFFYLSSFNKLNEKVRILFCKKEVTSDRFPLLEFWLRGTTEYDNVVPLQILYSGASFLLYQRSAYFAGEIGYVPSFVSK
jgi:hypothetical protein